MPMPLTVAEFVRRWKLFSQTENAGSQSHFLDLCDLLGEKRPAESDSAGENYAFQKHVSKTRGGKGFADVWLRDHFAWEYKGKHKSLQKAYEQLNDYREDLGNPPLLVVCDLDRFEVHTNFTSTSKRIYAFNLDDLNRNQVTATCPLPPLDVLRALFGDYNVLRPERTDAQVTKETAKLFSRLAERLELEDRNLGASRTEVAHFLMRLLFCLFADSIGLLPNHVFRNLILGEDRFNPKRFLRKLALLFEAMSEREGIFGEHSIRYFNGGLFDTASIIQLDKADLGILHEVTKNYDWSHVAPAIFGTLFERSLDPARRSLIGAHYTSEEDILTLIEPVLMRPLEKRWAEVKQRVLEELGMERAEEAARNQRQARLRADRKSEKLLGEWIEELTAVRVLDPACGSGNFLYVALRRMLDLWHEARTFATEQGISLVVPKMVSPSQLYGIETEFYAHELASVVVWIGFLQWKHEHNYHEDREPILEKLSNIEHGDAIMRYDGEGNAYEPEWPKADFVIGNPPFLGDKRMKRELNTPNRPNYVDDLRALFQGRIPGGADLVCYWFEKALSYIASGQTKRAGLLATNSIRQVANREVLDRIAERGNIFWAWSDRPWTLEGAAVRVSMIGFDNGVETEHVLDDVQVQEIHPDLSSDGSFATAFQLAENEGICFLGMMKGGPFDISSETARKMLAAPANPNGKRNSDVVKPRLIGRDILRRPSSTWVIDFTDLTQSQAALYELPFQYVLHKVKPVRNKNEDRSMRTEWWVFGRTRPALRSAMASIDRCIATSEIAKHRIFVWMPKNVIPDHRLHVFARRDDYFFGVLQSSPHVYWSLRLGSTFEDRPSYNSDTIFLTFPFPWPPGKEPTEAEDPRVKAIAEAARELVRLRDNWLNPPNCAPEELKKRTLTKLYNDRPEWLANAHRALDEAVFAAYGWPADLSKDEILARLLALNQQRASGGPA